MVTKSSLSPNILAQNPTLNAITLDFNQNLRFNYIIENVNALAEKRKNPSILDVGAGMGTLTNCLTRQFSCAAVNLETTRVHKLANQVVADGRHLPFIDGSFDFTVSCDVLEHIDDMDRSAFLSELQRCARIATILTFSTIHKQNPQQSGIRLLEALARSAPEWYTEHNSSRIVETPKVIDTLRNNEAEVFSPRPVTGFFALALTGLLQNIPWRGGIRSALNIISYVIVKLIDRPPYYGFGVTAIKSSARNGGRS